MTKGKIESYLEEKNPGFNYRGKVYELNLFFFEPKINNLSG